MMVVNAFPAWSAAMNRPTYVAQLTPRAMLRGLCIAVLALAASGCANLQTIGRRTDFPPEGQSKAIHLDAQQRLVLVAGQKFCAEPSPDALAAYASSLGFSIADGNKNSASVANALQGTVGSIGLRTQSITLMRDSLYRLCEAGLNEKIGVQQMAEFIRRSQDLTAVVLAIEQLTGAVVGSQVVLSGNASASSVAQLQSNQEALTAARQEKTNAKEALDDAQAKLESTENALKDATKAVADAKQAQSAVNADANATEPEKEQAQKIVDEALKAQGIASNDEAVARSRYHDAVDRLDDATRVVKIIEEAKDSAMASASAKASGDGRFDTQIQRNNLNSATASAIATAVQNMVEMVLTKDYSLDTCVGLITSNDAVAITEPVRQACLALLLAYMENKAKNLVADSGPAAPPAQPVPAQPAQPGRPTASVQRVLPGVPELKIQSTGNRSLLTEDEYRAIKKAAKDADVQMQTYKNEPTESRR
jgi:hypothetical protein